MIALHRQREGETDFERLWLGLIVVAGVAAAVWLQLGLRTPPCLFHTVTGVPCLTCGGTRCLKSLLAGHVVAAFEWNPLVCLAAVAAALYAFYAAVVTTLRLPRLRPGSFSPTEAGILRMAFAVVVAANWIYLVFHFSRIA